MRQVIFRADASPQIGGGHVVRCLALATALSDAGWPCAFHTSPASVTTVPALARAGHLLRGADETAPEPVDLLVVDHYGLDSAYERSWRSSARKILVIDDLADRPHECDFLLDQSPSRAAADYRDKVPETCRFLLGLDYALLRPEFPQARTEALARRHASQFVHRILVTPGATDPTDLASVLLEAIDAAAPDILVDVAIGGAAPHLPALRRRLAANCRASLHVDAVDMAGLMSRADLCLGAAGGTSWERCCLGLPTLLAVTSRDQAIVARGLVEAGAASLVDAAQPAEIAAALRALIADPLARSRQSQAAAALCDGRGALRVAQVMSR